MRRLGSWRHSGTGESLGSGVGVGVGGGHTAPCVIWFHLVWRSWGLSGMH